jgi:hypothetical protein
VVCNVLSALIGRRIAHAFPVPTRFTLTRRRGVSAMLAAGLWILSSRTFRQYLGGYGWFFGGAPRFWSYVPGWVVGAGVEIHGLGLGANTAIAGLLAAAAVIGLGQIRQPIVRVLAGAVPGFVVGNMMTPHYEAFHVGAAIAGTVGGLAFAACCHVDTETAPSTES